MSQLGRTRFLAVSQVLYLRGGEILEGRLWCSVVFGLRGVNVWLLTCVHMNGCRNKLGYAYMVAPLTEKVDGGTTPPWRASLLPGLVPVLNATLQEKEWIS